MNIKKINHALHVQNLTVAYRHVPVLWNINTLIPSGVMVGIVGPNGAGKTTFLQAILGLVKPIAGTVQFFDNQFTDIKKYIAYVPQRTSIDWDFPVTVFDVILMGRYVHLGWMRRPNKKDYDEVYFALHQVGLADYANRHISQLSGGQQQRVFLARALVQNAWLYIMDEPFVGVDMLTEQKIISILKQLRRQGKTIMVVHHDLQALDNYFDWILLLNKEVIACGPVHTVVTPDLIEAAFGKRNLCIKYRQQNMII